MLSQTNVFRLSLMGLALATFGTVGLTASDAEAGYRGSRQYYSSWSYRPKVKYYYTTYYYKPEPTYPKYSYHYCISYPSQPRYVYYYNPHSRRYWGRFDLEGKPGKQYSLLAKKDQKANLKDIPEKAFPKPGPMPGIPEAKDGQTITPPLPAPVAPLPGQDLPGVKAAVKANY